MDETNLRQQLAAQAAELAALRAESQAQLAALRAESESQLAEVAARLTAAESRPAGKVRGPRLKRPNSAEAAPVSGRSRRRSRVAVLAVALVIVGSVGTSVSAASAMTGAAAVTAAPSAPAPPKPAPGMPICTVRGQYAMWSGTVWSCGLPNSGTGLGTDSSGNVALAPRYQLPQNCTNGQLPAWTATTGLWACAAPGTTYAAGTGLNLNGTTFSLDPNYQLPQTCPVGDILRMLPGAATGPPAWSCASPPQGPRVVATIDYTQNGSIPSLDIGRSVGVQSVSRISVGQWCITPSDPTITPQNSGIQVTLGTSANQGGFDPTLTIGGYGDCAVTGGQGPGAFHVMMFAATGASSDGSPFTATIR